MNLSIYPARAIARRLPTSIDYRVPPVAGWPDPNGDGCSLCSTSITLASSLLRSSPPLTGALVLSALRLAPLVPFPLASPCSSNIPYKSLSSFAPPAPRMPLWPLSLSKLSPRMVTPRFSHHLISFRRFRSGSLALASLDPAGIIADVSATFTTVAFDDRSLRWLELDT